MSILFIGKRFYTNRDAYSEKFGRIYQLPYYWSKNTQTMLWLIDYHSPEKIQDIDHELKISSTPILSISFIITLLKIIFIHRPHTIVASGDCYIGLLSFILSKLCLSKFVFDIYDKYDEFDGYRNLGFKSLFNFLLKHANSTLFASQALITAYNIPSSFLVINGIDTSQFRPLEKNYARKKFNLKERSILIGYFGSMEPDRGIEDLIQAVQLLNKEKLKISVILGGNPPKHFSLEQENVHYLGNIPFKDVPYALAACDILAIPYRRSPFMDAGASNKIAEAIACLRPIVATKSPNFIANFPEQAKQLKPYLAEPGNAQSLAQAIKLQLHDLKVVSQSDHIFWPHIAQNTLNHISKGKKT